MSRDHAGGRRPVIVGVGQLANKDEDRLLHPMELVESATRLALEDSGGGLLATLDGIYTTPVSVFSPTSSAEELAVRLGVRPVTLVESRYTGSAPQEMMAAACGEIAGGRIRSAVVAGGIADASIRRARERGVAPPAPPTSAWSQGSQRPGELALTRQPRFGSFDGPPGERAAGLSIPVGHFAMIESALAAAAGRDTTQQTAWLGRLMAPFTEVAARHPSLAWFPAARRPAALSSVGPDNRMVAQPYPKLMTSFPTVDLAAALVVTSEEEADRAGIPASQRVYPWAAASCQEPNFPSERPDVGRTPALTAAVQRAAAAAGIDPRNVDLVDLYSCFPAAVQLGAVAIGLDPLARELTVTGGLPYFGGPGASYVTHALVTMVQALRGRPGATGLVAGVGGLATHFAAGLYSFDPPAVGWTNDLCEDVTDSLREQRVALDLTAVGTAQVEAMTVLHDRERGPLEAPVFARFADGRRTAARVAYPALAAELDGVSLVGRAVRIEVSGDQPTYVPA